MMKFKEYFQNLLTDNPMKEVSKKDAEFIQNIKQKMDFPLENHREFIRSVHDLLDRVVQKVRTLKAYQETLSDNINEDERQSKEYDFYNEWVKLENEIKKHFKSLVENMTLTKKLTSQILKEVYVEFVLKQQLHSSDCEFSFGGKNRSNIDIEMKESNDSSKNTKIKNSKKAKKTKEKKVKKQKKVKKEADYPEMKTPEEVLKTKPKNVLPVNHANLLGLSIAQESSANEIRVHDLEQNQFSKQKVVYAQKIGANFPLPPLEINSTYLSKSPVRWKEENFDAFLTNEETAEIKTGSPRMSSPKFMKSKSKPKKDKVLVC